MRIYRTPSTDEAVIVRTKSSITVLAGVREETPIYPAHLLKALDQVLGGR